MDTQPPSPGRSNLDPAAILAIERPHPKLMTYYFICCLLTGPFFLILILPNFFRYHTMRYRFDAEGISMRWGILFRREVILNYARIQDIHLVSNLLERWLGLARLQIQTASGSASAEMTLEGLLEVSTAGGGIPAHYRQTGGQQNSNAHRGFFHGIDNAPEIRDMMLERLRRLRDTGLGDPDEHHPAEAIATTASSPLIEAARDLLREAQALGRAGV